MFSDLKNTWERNHMKTGMELYEERLNRIATTIELGKPDRMPVILMADAFCARHMGVKISEFCTSVSKSNETIIKSLTDLGADGSEIVFMYAPLLAMAWNSKVKLPGRELPEDSMWQVLESGLMTVDDYDTILDKGWLKFLEVFYRERLDNVMEASMLELAKAPQAVMNMVNAGLVPFCPVTFLHPIDTLGGGRSLAEFAMDMRKMPDKLEAVLNIIAEELIAVLKTQLGSKPFAVFLGSGRGGCEYMSQKLWERLVWPHLKKAALTAIEAGSYVFFHLDSRWDRDISYFRELPKGKCVWGTDHSTDIYKLKKELDGHMCIYGDVPSPMFTLGTPQEVYDYGTKLIHEIGPTGFILAQACTVPANAKLENVKAMISASRDG
jgi:uroporphyrinogen-III decarboxylase